MKPDNNKVLTSASMTEPVGHCTQSYCVCTGAWATKEKCAYWNPAPAPAEPAPAEILENTPEADARCNALINKHGIVPAEHTVGYHRVEGAPPNPPTVTTHTGPVSTATYVPDTKTPSTDTAAGVPDIDGLVDRCIERASFSERQGLDYSKMVLYQAANTLAVLQSELSRETFRKIDQIRANQSIRKENAQQAERIKELESSSTWSDTQARLIELQAERINALTAKLAEAVRLIELSTAKGTTHCVWYAERDAFLTKTREVMG